ncbi:metallophosphoesterase [Mangrovimonas aestuarii]|uniref:metallophosphoesterase n=1 Tax=Mangrovimonas aestuarii TaxID=3018443 RepID=UPI00237878E7|nr:metallophosphoesterase [Mangrovimonas aestuarii]
MKVIQLRYYTVVLCLLLGCASFESHHKSLDIVNIESIDNETTNIFLIGDAGKLETDGSPPKALVDMQKQFSRADKNDLLLFLGDNVYPEGIPVQNQGEAVNVLKTQLKIAKTFPGKTFFIPGNHDWYSGIQGLKEQEKIVESVLGKNTFQPENGCPIEKIKVSDDVVLLIVDSHWYITNWDKHPKINDNCDLKTREDFLDEFRGQIKKNIGKMTLVAIHHPMFTYGPHGGHYSFMEHMKPLPIIGTAKNILRTTSGVVNADIYNQFYNDLRKNLIAASQHNDKVIFLSGHEHSLQYIETDNVKQIISGSGSKVTAVKAQKGAGYGEGALGYAILSIKKNQSVSVQFVNVETKTISYRKTLFPAKQNIDKTYETLSGNNMKATIYSKQETDKSKFYRLLWGERFRDYYSTPVTAKVVYLDTLMGGMKPKRRGGGTQSKSLHLETEGGRRYVMRAMRKQAAQFIQSSMFQDQYVEGQFINTTSEGIIEDVFTGAHPYAPFVIGRLSDAINLAHLNPRLFYIPKQEALGSYNEEFGDELYLFEEHASEGHTELTSRNDFTGKIVSTFDMIQEVQSDESKVIDEVEFVKARLFDMLVGDADRHQDQWRWMEFKEQEKTVYRPLPRDRDLCFSKMSDGFLFGTALHLIPPARKFRGYESDLMDVKGFNVSGFPLDVAFTNSSEKSVWDEQVQYIQSKITDEVIEEAFNSIPEEVRDVSIDEIINLFKKRRENLQDISDRYYKLVNKFAVLTATNKDDFIKIENNENGSVKVSMFRKKGGEIKDEFHNRIYDPTITKEIWIYGLDDDDTFEVTGKSKSITIRLIGGQNNDQYIVQQGKNIVIYDYKSKNNTIDQAKKARIKLTDDYNVNVYDYRKLRNNVNQLLPMIGFNPDDGIKMGFTDTYTTYGFIRNPFTSRHQFGANYYFATNGFELDYRGEIAHVIGHLNALVEARFHSPNFSLNFFGYGNETENFDDDEGLDFNRVKVREFSVAPSLLWNSKRGSIIQLGFTYETIEVQNTPNRFLDFTNVLPFYVFDEVSFGGVNVKYNFSNYDNIAYPTIGMRFDLDFGYKNNLSASNKDFTFLIPTLGIAHKLNNSGRLVIATKIKGHFNFGNGFEFYQAATIGGDDGVRGYRNQRFTGKRSFYQNTDLRYSFNRMKTQLIPIKIGVYGSFDYGRVWVMNDTSNKWHNSYGGGLFINAVEFLSSNLGIFNSSDGIRVAFGLGFGF